MHHRTYIALAALTAALGIASPASAQESQPAAAAAQPAAPVSGTQATDDCARARARNPDHTCVIDFGTGGDEVYGTLLAPEGDALAGRRQLVFSSLLHLRTDFISAIVKTADDLP
jgi:hypothetical protein